VRVSPSLLLRPTPTESRRLSPTWPLLRNPGHPLVCGIRLGWFNATWPAGRCRLGDESIGFSCLGFAAEANWADVEAVELIKPMNQIGWGVRFRIPSMKPTSAIVWLGSQQLADKVIEICAFHEVLTEKNARAVL
jgi:hypothetical protein